MREPFPALSHLAEFNEKDTDGEEASSHRRKANRTEAWSG